MNPGVEREREREKEREKERVLWLLWVCDRQALLAEDLASVSSWSNQARFSWQTQKKSCNFSKFPLKSSVCSSSCSGLRWMLNVATEDNAFLCQNKIQLAASISHQHVNRLGGPDEIVFYFHYERPLTKQTHFWSFWMFPRLFTPFVVEKSFSAAISQVGRLCKCKFLSTKNGTPDVMKLDQREESSAEWQPWARRWR